MKYWHIQLHPDDKWEYEEELLKTKKIIGIGDYWEAGKSQIDDFLHRAKINDIVLVRRGKKAIALVKIIGEVEDIGANNFDQIDWFRFRRKIEVLEFAKDKDPFPQSRGTFKLIKDINTDSYKYVDSWYKSIMLSENSKIKNIYIKNYKILKDFSIQLNTINVLVGINGSGKTSVLEFIANLPEITYKKDNQSYVELNNEKINFYNEPKEQVYIGDGVQENKKIKKYLENIIYIPIFESQDLSAVKKHLIERVKKEIFIQKKNIVDVYQEIHEFIENIFENIDIAVNFSHIDENDNVFFENKNSDKFQIENLSSGEKNLMIKVLDLYLKDIKNKIVLIDEPELSLHPSWQNRIIKIYENLVEKYNCQIIIATHSPQIIGSAKAEYLKILNFDENNNMEILTYDKSYGLKFNRILIDIMGVKYLRVPEVQEKIDKLKEYILNKDADKFIKLYRDLSNVLGKDDTDLQLLKLEAKLKGNINVSSL